jgi:hypothetical protein
VGEISIEELHAKLGEFHPRTEWEVFMNRRLTVEEEADVREQVIALLRQVENKEESRER